MSPRPPRTNRQEIVRAAIALIDADGIDSFSMRRLASAMGVDPMTLYHHLPNRAALLDAVVDELWSSIELGEPAPGTEWRESLAGLAHRLRGVRPESQPVPMTIGEGGRDGDIVPLRFALDRLLPEWEERSPEPLV